jgi:DNA-directed RNA polymerase subunit M/transcription elongation factor TFIIS
LASAGSNYNFDCPECDQELTVSHKQTGSQIPCTHCGKIIHVPSPISTAEKLLVGMIEEEEFEHPGTLKIDGIDDANEDGSSWHIKCHICDSVLLVHEEQVGGKVKCNDCYSMLDVLPNRKLQKIKGVADGSDLEIIEEEAIVAVPKSRPKHDDDELTLMPAADLSPEVTDAQKENFLDELNEDEPLTELTEVHLDEDEPLQLSDSVSVSKVDNPMFRAAAPVEFDDDDDDDSDEMIEILDVSPEKLNEDNGIAFLPDSSGGEKTKELPRMPRKGKKQPAPIPVPGDDDDAPVRVHAKRRPKKKTRSAPSQIVKEFEFDQATPNEFLEKAMGVLGSRKIWVWAAMSILLMATGSAVWQWIRPENPPPEGMVFSERIIGWASSMLFGQLVFFAGYIVLLFVGGVIFRETALGKTKVESVSVANMPDFTSTMLLFGFSMFIAALPCMFFGLMPVSLPFQFFLAGIFLFAAWKNQAAFQIVSGSIFESFSEHAASWKNWAIGAGIAAVGGVVGGGLMEVYVQGISIFTSIAGAILVAMVTLFYAAITGWHCGNVVEKMND